MRVIWSPSALREVARATDYLMDFNPAAAVRLAEGLLAAGDSLANFPHRGRRVSNTDMRELITDYPYIIRYASCVMKRFPSCEDGIPHGGHQSLTVEYPQVILS